jgi:hypothetical protein
MTFEPFVLDENLEERLSQFGKAVFGERWASALAKACGVSRQTVHGWPPADEMLMDQHLEKACRVEIDAALQRLDLLHSIYDALALRRKKVARRVAKEQLEKKKGS